MQDLIEFSSVGEETENGITKKNYDKLSSTFVATTDWTIETIVGQIKKKNIDLNPKFQRRDAWNNKTKSNFIESIFLGLPIPQIVLAEKKNKKGKFIVIDGKQRLLTLRQFEAEKDDPDFKTFKLSGLKQKEDFNGYNYKKLSDNPRYVEDIDFFDNQTIRTVIIRNWPDEDFLYLIFLRLNTGSVKLSPQELRQALHPGGFIDFADDFSQNSTCIKNTLKLNKPDKRMRDVELVIRFFAFKNFLDQYHGGLKELFDLTCETLNKKWETNPDQIENEAHQLELALKTTEEIFGENNAFRKYSADHFDPRFNRAIFDIMVFYFSDENISEIALKEKDKIVEAFKELSTQDAEFRDSLEKATSTPQNIHTRLSKWGNELATVLHIYLPIPTLQQSTITY
ncbi:MAG: DUF262 domain-containing protein [Microscillaceae bacterium]|nr:DUF262 domain-containing protein [Microscillaceae bacterium]